MCVCVFVCYQAHHGHNEILQLLLPLFPDTNIKEDSGKTPLDLAAYKGHKQCIELLLRFGASVSVQVRIWIFIFFFSTNVMYLLH